MSIRKATKQANTTAKKAYKFAEYDAAVSLAIWKTFKWDQNGLPHLENYQSNRTKYFLLAKPIWDELKPYYNGWAVTPHNTTTWKPASPSKKGKKGKAAKDTPSESKITEDTPYAERVAFPVCYMIQPF